MDFDQAIAAHAQWKMKFRSAISGQQVLDQASIAKDNRCDLGQWLYGEGHAQCGSKLEFSALLQRHKSFHTEAGKVAQAINARDYARAEQMIANGTPYAAASDAIGAAVWAIRKACEQAAQPTPLRSAWSAP